MLKFEWPLIVPEDAAVAKLAKATFDVSEYIVDIARKEGLAPGLSPLDGGVTVQLACHARAQNMGQKAAEMLRLLPEADVAVIERCSGHGGSWGVLKGNFETAVKVGRPVARQALEERETVPRLRMSARRHAHRAGNGDAGGRRIGARTLPAPDRARRPRLRHSRGMVRHRSENIMTETSAPQQAPVDP